MSPILRCPVAVLASFASCLAACSDPDEHLGPGGSSGDAGFVVDAAPGADTAPRTDALPGADLAPSPDVPVAEEDAGVGPDAAPGDRGDPAWYAPGRVAVESWYPTRGGQAVGAASFWSEPLRYRRRTAPLEACVSYGPGEDEWAGDPRCIGQCPAPPGQVEYCGDDGMCHRRPAWISAGPVTITTSSGTLELQFEQPPCMTAGCYSRPAAAPPLGAIPAGARVTFAATGDVFPSFSGQLEAPPALQILSPPLLVFPSATPIAAGSDLILRWVPAGPDDRLEISFVSLYGGVVRCTAVDDGEMTIPWMHLARLPQGTNELEGFFERRRTSRIQTPGGEVDLEAASIESGTFIIR
jgi:hypothetical protein